MRSVYDSAAAWCLRQKVSAPAMPARLTPATLTASSDLFGRPFSIDGFVLLATLVAWNFALDWLSFHFEPVARFLEPRPEVLIRNGRLNRRALRREMITTDELRGKLREQGVADFSEVRVARLESDGTLSVFKKEKSEQASEQHQPPETSKPPAQ